jgi:hypothetical protein
MADRHGDVIFRARDMIAAEGVEPFDALRILIERALVQRMPLARAAEMVVFEGYWGTSSERVRRTCADARALCSSARETRAESRRVRAESAALRRQRSV